MSDRADGSASIEVTADGSEFERGFRAMVRRADGTKVEVDVELNRTAANRLSAALGGLAPDAGRAGGRVGDAFGSGMSNSLETALSSIANIRLPAPAFAVLGGAIASAAASAIQFTAAVAPAVGILAALPAQAGAAAGGVAVLQTALLGVGDAFEAAVTGDQEEFSEALEGLAPSAQAAAQALRDITPEFAALRESVQGAFFEGFDQVISDIGENLAGPLSTGMTAVAEAMNAIAIGIGDIITSADGVAFIETTFAALAGFLETMRQPILDVVQGFLDIGTAVGDAFGEEAGSGLASLVSSFGAFLSEAAASGQAVEWVQGALEVFRQLGTIISAVAGIFGSIGDAARQSGGDILTVLGEALQGFNEFLASAQGMDFLVSIFETLNTVGSILGTVLAALAPALVPFVEAWGALLTAVAPFIEVIARVAGGFLLVAAVVNTLIITAVAPLVEFIGTLLVNALNFVMPIITERLIPALISMGEQLGPPIAQFSALAGQLAERLAPVIANVAAFVINLAVEAIPVLVVIVQTLIGWITSMINGFNTTIDVISSVIGWFGDLGGTVSDVSSSIGGGIQAIIDAGANLRDDMLGFIDDIIGAWNNLLDNITSIASSVSGAVSGIDIPFVGDLDYSGPVTHDAFESPGATGLGTDQSQTFNLTMNTAATDPLLQAKALRRTLTGMARGALA